MIELIQVVADERDRCENLRPWKWAPFRTRDDTNFVGACGEAAFAQEFGLPFDVRNTGKENGDNGVDFVLPSGLTVDVKTARKPKWLLVRPRRRHADVYVLARFTDPSHVDLLGWHWGSEVMSRALLDRGGYGIKSHSMAVAELLSMEALRRFL